MSLKIMIVITAVILILFNLAALTSVYVDGLLKMNIVFSGMTLGFLFLFVLMLIWFYHSQDF